MSDRVASIMMFGRAWPSGAVAVDPHGSRASDRVRVPEPVRLALFTDTYPPQLNGVSRTLDRLVRAVAARGGATRVYTTSDPAVDPAGDLDAGRRYAGDAGVWRRPSVPFWAYPQLRMAAPILGRAYHDVRRWRPTLIHAATPFGMGLTGRSCARMLGVPLVTSYHTSFNEYAKFYRLGALSAPGWAYIRWFHNSGARTYAPTHTVIDELSTLGFHRLALWGRGVEARVFNPSFRDPAWRSRLGATDDTTVVVYVGRLAAEKGLDTALAAMHRLADRASGAATSDTRRERRRIVFAVAGDGPYAAHCRRAAPPPPAAHFVGRLEGQALSAFYALADLFMFPSSTDTFGNVLLEAMASGVPVIGAEAGPTRELLAAGGGVIVPRNDPDALAQAIVALADDPVRRAELGARGVAYAATCSWDRVFDALIEDYRTVMRSRVATA